MCRGPCGSRSRPLPRWRKPPCAPAAGAADITALPRDLSPWGMFLSADPLVKAVLIGLAFASVVTWTVWLAKTIELIMARRRVARGSGDARRGAAARRRRRADQTRRRARPRTFLEAAVAEIRLSAGQRRAGRHQGAHRLAAGADRGRLRPAHHARHQRARHHRGDRPVRRPVRHGLGHHEQLHRHLEGAHHQSGGGGAGHRGGAAGDRLRAGGRDPGGRHLQHVRALDLRLSGAARRRLGRRAAAGEPRPRPPSGGEPAPRAAGRRRRPRSDREEPP